MRSSLRSTSHRSVSRRGLGIHALLVGEEYCNSQLKVWVQPSFGGSYVQGIEVLDSDLKASGSWYLALFPVVL